MKRLVSAAGAGVGLLAACAAGAALPAVVRVEARSATLLAVGIVRDEHMSIHLSRLLDNAPVRDAVLNVSLRGVVHPTLAETDGGYALQTTDLRVPGSASVEFLVTQGPMHDDLKGTLLIADDARTPDGSNSARQIWWWVLNFAVCIGFLMLISRRRKAASQDPD